MVTHLWTSRPRAQASYTDAGAPLRVIGTLLVFMLLLGVAASVAW